MSLKILIAEDDKKIARLLQLLLEDEDYNTEIVYDGKTALETAKSKSFDLVLLDIMMPRMNGIDVCRKIREFSKTPIIIISAKDEISDKVIGLELGADDYITKPFSNEEFIARVKAMLRRVNNSTEEKDEQNILTCGKLKINQTNYTTYYENEEIMLTKKEFELLEYLMINKGVVLKRDQILYNVWDYDYIGNDSILDLYIKYLRDKLDKKFNVKIIHTIRGVGFTIKKEIK